MGSLAAKAIKLIQQDELEKATMAYSHKEGNSILPSFVYQDEVGNMQRRSNAPQGHPDYDGSYADEDETLDLSQEEAPQFYTTDGRKLSRAPYTGTDVQWNQNYHQDDPQNMWAARWVNPVTGEHEFSYIDSDLSTNDRFKIHRENALVDNRITGFRQYVSALFASPHMKDGVVSLVLMLLDQGRFRVKDLLGLRVQDLHVAREIVSLGSRSVHCDLAVAQKISEMVGGRGLGEPLFSTPTLGMDGSLDYSKSRRIGPHFAVNLLAALGLSAEALQTYHATQTYSMAVQRALGSGSVGFQQAHMFALSSVASELGHDLSSVEDFEPALRAIESATVDPLAVSAIQASCTANGIPDSAGSINEPVYSSVPHVSSTLSGKDRDEEEFSLWLRTAPIHTYG
ncbi:MAG: hypothetical protein L3J47_00540 [Sulfurovum sp.]|nr:hypothetical protein [Sulfurovum sp.]